MPTRGLVIEDYPRPDPEPKLADLILQAKSEHPGIEVRIALYEIAGSAQKTVSRFRTLFREAEPDIAIYSRKEPLTRGTGVYVKYTPPELHRGSQ